MIEHDDSLTARQVAAFLGHSRDWFYRNRARLEREQGFPKPVPGINRWDPGALVAWRLAQQGIPLQAAGELGRRLTEREWAEELDRNAAAIAAGLARKSTAA